MKTVLTIAGSDCSGGAGIQADLKTIAAHGLYGMSVITALTAQNTQSVSGIVETPPAFVAEQIDRVFEDIRPDAVKIGMVGSAEIIEAVAASLQKWQAENIVIDPVMVATSGAKLLDDAARQTLCRLLLPLGAVLTPNLAEASVLCGYPVRTMPEMQQAATALSQQIGVAVLIKGGHLTQDATDLLANGAQITAFLGERVDTADTHGTGCTLSSAIACGLAVGKTLPNAVRDAKEYLTGALRAGLRLGHGAGPLDHGYRQRNA